MIVAGLYNKYCKGLSVPGGRLHMNKKNYFPVKEMMPGVYGFSNCAVASFLIVGKEKALLFDTGYGAYLALHHSR